MARDRAERDERAWRDGPPDRQAARPPAAQGVSYLQRTIGNRATGHLLDGADLARPAPDVVIQRKIAFGEKVYTADDAAAFGELFSEAERKKILSAINGELDSGPFATIDDALRDPRTFAVTTFEAGGETQYEASVPDEVAAVSAVPGGQTRIAASRSELIERPAGERSEVLEIKGLVMCVGIVLEARDDHGTVRAASGLHFLSSTYVEDGVISEAGKRLIDDQILMTAKFGKELSAVLFFCSREAPKLAPQAVAAVAAYLHGKAEPVLASDGDGDRSYRLPANGKPSYE